MLMFLSLCGCWLGFEDPELVLPKDEFVVIPEPTVTFGRYPVEMCVVLAGDGPWPTLAVTLWRMEEGGVDAQRELSGGEGSATRCAKETITLPRERANIGMIVDYMPRPLNQLAKTLRIHHVSHPETMLEVDSVDGHEFRFTLSTRALDTSQGLVLTNPLEPGDG